MKQFILTSTVSGDGYSNPIIKIFDTREEVEVLKAEVLASFEGILIIVNDEGDNCAVNTFSNEENLDEDIVDDYWRIQIFEVEVGSHLVRVDEPNEVEIRTFENKDIAMKEMKWSVECEEWDEDCDKYEGEEVYGGHSLSADGGNYVHFQVV